jgi:hypothetical protein
MAVLFSMQVTDSSTGTIVSDESNVTDYYGPAVITDPVYIKMSQDFPIKTPPSTETIGPLPKDQKTKDIMKYCQQEADKDALAKVIPFGDTIIKGETLYIGPKDAGEEAWDNVREHAGKSTAFLYAVRSHVGMPMSITSKITRGVGYAGTAFTLFQGAQAAWESYDACMARYR